MKKIKDIIGNAAAIGIALIMLFVIISGLLSKVQPKENRTNQILKEEHMRLYVGREKDNQAIMDLVDSPAYVKIMDTIDEKQQGEIDKTDKMMAIQQVLRADCEYWDPDAVDFYKEEDCHDDEFAYY